MTAQDRDAAIRHLRAVLADDGNCTANESQDSSCPRCQARAFLADYRPRSRWMTDLLFLGFGLLIGWWFL